MNCHSWYTIGSILQIIWFIHLFKQKIFEKLKINHFKNILFINSLKFILLLLCFIKTTHINKPELIINSFNIKHTN